VKRSPVRHSAAVDRRRYEREFPLARNGVELVVTTQPGVFSYGEADEGSLLLLDSVSPEARPHWRVLDLGTGVGLIGLALAPLLSRGEVWMVDSDVRATRLAQRNVERNRLTNAHVLTGDGTLDLPKGLRFHAVVTNPPTHDGNLLLESLMRDAYAVLRPGGSLYVVVNRLLSVRQILTAIFGNCDIAARAHGFVVLHSRKERRTAAGQTAFRVV